MTASLLWAVEMDAGNQQQEINAATLHQALADHPTKPRPGLSTWHSPVLPRYSSDWPLTSHPDNLVLVAPGAVYLLGTPITASRIQVVSVWSGIAPESPSRTTYSHLASPGTHAPRACARLGSLISRAGREDFVSAKPKLHPLHPCPVSISVLAPVTAPFSRIIYPIHPRISICVTLDNSAAKSHHLRRQYGQTQTPSLSWFHRSVLNQMPASQYCVEWTRNPFTTSTDHAPLHFQLDTSLSREELPHHTDTYTC